MEHILKPEEFINVVSRFLSLTNNGLIIINVSGKDLPIVYTNSGFFRLTGYNADEIIGHDIKVLLGSKSNDKGSSIIDKILIDKIGGSLHSKLYRKNQSYFDALLAFTPLYSENGEIDYIFAILEDITEKKENIEREASIKTYRTTIETVNDIIFNYMNFLKIFNDELGEINEETPSKLLSNMLDTFEDEYRIVFKKLTKLNDLSSFSQKKLSKDLNIININ